MFVQLPVLVGMLVVAVQAPPQQRPPVPDDFALKLVMFGHCFIDTIDTFEGVYRREGAPG